MTWPISLHLRSAWDRLLLWPSCAIHPTDFKPRSIVNQLPAITYQFSIGAFLAHFPGFLLSVSPEHFARQV